MTNRRWAYYLVAGCALGAVGIVTDPTFRRGLTMVMGVAGTTLTFLLSRRLPKGQRRPWEALSLAGTFYLLGALVRAIHSQVSGQANPYPSPADVLYFLSYFGLIAAVVLLVRLRTGSNGDSTMNLDAIIVAAGIAIAEWGVALGPYVHDTRVPLDQRVVSLLFASVMIVLAAATIRLSVGPGFRNPAFWLLAVGMGVILIADLTASLATAGSVSRIVPESLGPFIWGFWVAAALHPEAHRLTERPPSVEARLSWQRLLLLATALLIVPTLTIWQVRRPDGVDLPVIVVGWVVLASLVLVRLADLVRSKEQAATEEGILRRANGDLAAARSSDEMTDAAIEATHALVARHPGTSAYIGIVQGSSMVLVRSVGPNFGIPHGTDAPIKELPWSVPLFHGEHDGATPHERSYLVPPEEGAFGQTGRHKLIAPLVTQASLRGAIILTTPKLPPRNIQRAIEQLASTLSLALESATLTENLHRERSERRFKVLVENSSDIVVVADQEGVLSFASPACRHVLGVDPADVVGMTAVGLIHPDDRPLAAEVLREAGSGNDDHLDPVEVRIRHADGSYRWFEARARDLSGDPEVGGMVINAREISDRKAAEEEILRREARFRALVQHSGDIVVVVDAFGTISYVSPAVHEALGYQPEELLNTSVFDLLDLEERNIVMRRTDDLDREARRSGTFDPISLEISVRHRDGSLRYLDITVTDLRQEKAVGGVVLNARDVTVRKTLEHDLRHQALHDSLTGLGNRAMFLHNVSEALDNRSPELTLATLFIDLDDFKTVNDSLGHGVGDELLVRVADRLSTCLHHSDVAARLGGDEFAVLVKTPHGRGEAAKLAERILNSLRAPFDLQPRSFSLAASIGIAFEEEGSTAELLLRNADMAMYLAKERGKDRFEVFEPDMHASVFERLVLKADLAHGIESGQLRLCYQPIVSLQTGRITGVEALVRWNHPTRGPLGPDQFVRLAEDTGLIVPLGQWVLEEACRQLRSWQLRLPPGASLTMSVNLSVRQLESDDVIQQIADTIHEHQIDPSTITMELTESMLMEDTEFSRRRLNELKAVGVSLAVDDFGTGYSSLGYVQQYPVDIIKIDRSFVDGLSMRSGNEVVVVQTMIEMAQRLGVHIVAEGIEELDQLRALQTLGCDLGQGYFFSRPVEAHLIGPLLSASIADGSQFLANGGKPAA